MAFYSYLSTKIIIAFITKSYKDLFGVRSYINAYFIACCMFIRLWTIRFSVGKVSFAERRYSKLR